MGEGPLVECGLESANELWEYISRMANVRIRCAKEAPMDYKITGYEPAKLFHYFEEISAIPRESGT